MLAETLYIDSDNALGSSAGDIDDGVALAALLASGLEVSAIASIFGNTSSASAFENIQKLSSFFSFNGKILRGAEGPNSTQNVIQSEASDFLLSTKGKLKILALGPLTNVLLAIQKDQSICQRISEIILVGGNTSSFGRWPPLFPFEFNLTKDKAATRCVMNSNIPLTIVPLDVAIKFRFSAKDLAQLPGSLGAYLQQNSKRWLLRSQLLWWQKTVPIWDLLAAYYLIEPSLLEVKNTSFEFHNNCYLEFGTGDRSSKVVTAFQREAIWQHFSKLLGASANDAPVLPTQ